MVVYNINYSNLLIWIDRFRELNISHISANTSTRHILESIENLDTVYEAWIFLEFVEYVHQKGNLKDFRLRNQPSCKFSHNGRIITFWYEKKFVTAGVNAWVVEHRPDFTAMLDDEILAIFDAKNYTGSISEPKNKMLAYMANLGGDFSALIFPNHPKNWDEYEKTQRIEKLESLILTVSGQQFEDKDELKRMARKFAI